MPKRIWNTAGQGGALLCWPPAVWQVLCWLLKEVNELKWWGRKDRRKTLRRHWEGGKRVRGMGEWHSVREGQFDLEQPQPFPTLDSPYCNKAVYRGICLYTDRFQCREANSGFLHRQMDPREPEMSTAHQRGSAGGP